MDRRTLAQELRKREAEEMGLPAYKAPSEEALQRMDRRALAHELRKWAVEEMGLPPQKAPSEEALQRICVGQCADIWKYIIRHMRSERTVRHIEANLLWYQQLQQSEGQRSAEDEEQQLRKQLCREIQELKSELPQLEEQIRSAEKEIINQEPNIEKSQDYRRRALLLQAFKKKKEKEYEELLETNTKLQRRCEQLADISRESQREIIFPTLESSSASGSLPEPKVMRDVREVCQMRWQFLRSLFDDAVSGSPQTGQEELRSVAHQQWLSMAEKVWSAHPPKHIIASLERLALESTRDLRQRQSSLATNPSQSSSNISETTCDGNDSRDAPESSKQASASYVGDLHRSPSELPSFNSLIQEGWTECAKVTVQLCATQRQLQEVSERLAGRIQEVHKTLADGSENSQLSRAAFEAELQTVVLRGRRDTLLQECRALQESAVDRKQEVKLLQQQQQDLQDSRLLLNKKQKQIQILIRANAEAKSQIQRSSTEVQKFVKEKLLLRPQEVAQECEHLKDYVMKDVKHFSSISLPAFQKLCTDGVNEVPAQDLSINRLSNPQCLYYDVYKGIYASLGLPSYKAPETFLSHVADMKKQLLFLRSQLNSRNQAVNKMQKKLRESKSPDTDALLKLLSDHYAHQTNQMVPRLQRLTEQCQKSQEYAAEFQGTMKDWWEQPAQMCLPWEQRGGLTLQQWCDRWTVALTALQRLSGGR